MVTVKTTNNIPLKKTRKKTRKLTKKQIKINKRERFILTKKYKTKQTKLELKKKDKEWSLKIREQPCFVCGTNVMLHAHHLLPREYKPSRHLIINGVSVCASHHKYNINISAHKSPAMFMMLLEKKSPQQFEWLRSQLQSFEEKEIT